MASIKEELQDYIIELKNAWGQSADIDEREEAAIFKDVYEHLEGIIADSEPTKKPDTSKVNLPIKLVVSSFIQDWAKENKVNPESVTIGIERGKTHKKYRYLYLYDDEFRAINNMEL